MAGRHQAAADRAGDFAAEADGARAGAPRADAGRGVDQPAVRARQTAEIVAGAFSPHPPVVNIDALAPGGALPTVAAEIAKHGRRPHIVSSATNRGWGAAAGSSARVIPSSSRRAASAGSTSMAGRCAARA